MSNAGGNTKSLILHFSWTGELQLAEVSFWLPGTSHWKTGTLLASALASHSGREFTWSPGPQALSILILRSVAAAVDGHRGFFLEIPEVKRGKSDETRNPTYPGITIRNLLKRLKWNDCDKKPWVWAMFGTCEPGPEEKVDPEEEGNPKSQASRVFRASDHQVQMVWPVLSPATDVTIRCNGELVRDSYTLHNMADEVERKHFPKARAATSNLPRKRKALVGREDESANLRQLLLSHPLVVLVGAGGSGKTDLCYEIARQVEHQYTEVRLVELGDLASNTGRRRFVGEVAKQLSSNLAKGKEATIDSTARFIGSKRFLLVLDNCEHLREQCKCLVDGLLDNSNLRHLQIMATSREVLGCQGEEIVEVGGLAYPPKRLEAPTLDDINSYGSVALFCQQMRERSPSDADAPHLADICRIFEGIPYSIELVASQANKRPMSKVAESLQAILPLGLSQAKHQHQQLVEASLQWSYDLLDDNEQKLLRRLSVCMGGWTRDAAKSICSDEQFDATQVDQALDSLIDKSLVEMAPSRERFHFLVPTGQFASQRLGAAERERSRQQHLHFYLGFPERIVSCVSAQKQLEELSQLDEEYRNVRAAVQQNAFGGEGSVAGYTLIHLVLLFWSNRIGYREGLRDLLASSHLRFGQVREIMQADAWNCAGLLAWSLGDTSKANRCLAKASRVWESVLTLRSGIDAADLTGSRERGSPNGMRDGGTGDSAEDDQAYGMCRVTSTDVCKMKLERVLYSLGHLHLQIKEFTKADECFRRSRFLSSDVHRPQCRTVRVGSANYMIEFVADHWEAASYFAEVLAMQMESESRSDLRWCLDGVAQLAATQDENVLSTRLFGAAEQARIEASVPGGYHIIGNHEHVQNTLRRKLGNTSYESEWQTGVALDHTEAIDMAIDFCLRH